MIGPDLEILTNTFDSSWSINADGDVVPRKADVIKNKDYVNTFELLYKWVTETCGLHLAEQACKVIDFPDIN